MGKNVFERVQAESSYWLVGDSHIRRLFGYLTGLTMTAISGGQWRHMMNLMEGRLHSLGLYDAIFALSGSNDLQNRPISRVKEDCEKWVYRVIDKYHRVKIITGTIIPREGYSGGRDFAVATSEFDQIITQQGPCHHHFVTNAFYDDWTNGETMTTNLRLFDKDGTHLETEGLILMKKIIEFCYESIIFDQFNKELNLQTHHGIRTIYWKF